MSSRDKLAEHANQAIAACVPPRSAAVTPMFLARKPAGNAGRRAEPSGLAGGTGAIPLSAAATPALKHTRRATMKPRLVYLYGPPAVGKLAVASELSAQTGIRLIRLHE